MRNLSNDKAEQKRRIAQVASITGVTESQATRYLRSTSFDTERAIDLFFNGDYGQAALTAPLNSIFDGYRDASAVEEDKIGIEGAIKFFEDIGVQLDEIACIAIAELCRCPSMGEFTRQGFVSGWRSVNVGTLALMKQHVKSVRLNLQAEPAFFRRVYRFCFPLSRMQGQRNIQFEIASEQWALFFGPQSVGLAANTATTPWLDYWIEFLESRGKKPIIKDLWEQFEVFLRKAHEDESLGWWNENDAWPGAIDDFVAFVQTKRAGTEMELE